MREIVLKGVELKVGYPGAGLSFGKLLVDQAVGFEARMRMTGFGGYQVILDECGRILLSGDAQGGGCGSDSRFRFWVEFEVHLHRVLPASSIIGLIA
jgi:hypothetical protein